MVLMAANPPSSSEKLGPKSFFKVNKIKLSLTESYSAQLVLRSYRNSCLRNTRSSCFLKFVIFFSLLISFLFF